MTQTPHPASTLSEQERSDYLVAVAFIALGDRAGDPTARSQLEAMGATLGISEDAARRAVDAAVSSDRAHASRVLANLRQSELRVALLTDVIVLAFADAQVATAEAASIAWLARQMNMTTADVVLIGRYVEGVVQGHSEEPLAKKLAEKLAALPGSVPHHSVVSGLLARLRKSHS